MLQDKRSELDAERRKEVLTRMLQELSAEDPGLYYRATSDIAAQIRARIDDSKALNGEERSLLAPLTRRDIAVLLSLH